MMSDDKETREAWDAYRAEVSAGTIVDERCGACEQPLSQHAPGMPKAACWFMSMPGPTEYRPKVTP